MKIRKAKKEDLKEIKRFFREEYSKPPYNGKWDENNSSKAINEHFKKFEVYVAELDKEVVGFTILERFTSSGEEVCFIVEIIVGNDFQGKGIGKKLMKFIEDYSKKRKINIIRLSTNKDALAFKFYKKIGYNERKGGQVPMEKKLK